MMKVEIEKRELSLEAIHTKTLFLNHGRSIIMIIKLPTTGRRAKWILIVHLRERRTEERSKNVKKKKETPPQKTKR